MRELDQNELLAVGGGNKAEVATTRSLGTTLGNFFRKMFSWHYVDIAPGGEDIPQRTVNI